MSPRKSHYEFLGVEPSAPREEIEGVVNKLSNEANARDRTSARRAQEIRKRLPSIKRDLLTTEDRRQAYDHRLEESALAEPSEEVQGDEQVEEPESHSAAPVAQRALSPMELLGTGLRSSLWIAWLIPGPSLLWIGVLWVGVRARQRIWILGASIYFLLNLVLTLWTASYAYVHNNKVPTAEAQKFFFLSLLLWLIGIVGAFVLRGRYAPFSLSLPRIGEICLSYLRGDRRKTLAFALAGLGLILLILGQGTAPLAIVPKRHALLAFDIQFICLSVLLFLSALGLSFLLAGYPRAVWLPGVGTLVVLTFANVALALTNFSSVGWLVMIAGAALVIGGGILFRRLPDDVQEQESTQAVRSG